MKQALVLATHDTRLALAARAFGIEVLGLGAAYREDVANDRSADRNID